MIIEDGTGVENANCYVSLTEADNYFDETSDNTWSSLSDDDKTSALVKATRFLDRRYANQWIGVRKTQNQGLAWPRVDARAYRLGHFIESYGLIDSDGYSLEDMVPSNLKKAVFELAKSSAEGNSLYPETATAGVTSESIKVGPITISNSYSDPSTIDTGRVVSAEIEDLLTDLVIQGSDSIVVKSLRY